MGGKEKSLFILSSCLHEEQINRDTESASIIANGDFHSTRDPSQSSIYQDVNIQLT